MKGFIEIFERQTLKKTIRLTVASFDDGDIALFLVQWGSIPKNVGLIKGTIKTSWRQTDPGEDNKDRPGLKDIEWDWEKGQSGWYEKGDVVLKEFEEDFKDTLSETIFKGNDIKGTGHEDGMFITGKRDGDRITSSSNLMAWFVYAPAAKPASADTGKKEKEAEVIDEQAKEAEEEADTAEKEADKEAKKPDAKPADVKEKQEYAKVARANSEKLLEKAKKVHEYDIFYTEFNTPPSFSAEFIKKLDKYHTSFWQSSWKDAVSNPKNHKHYVDDKTLVWGIEYKKTYYFAKERARSLGVFQLSEEFAGDIKPGWVFPSAVRFDTRHAATRKKDGETKTASETIQKTNVESGIQSLRAQLAALTLRLELSGAVKKDEVSALPAQTQLALLRDKIKRTGSMIESNLAGMRRVHV